MKPKTFFKKWGEGIKKVNAYQLARISYRSNYIVLVGILGGIIVSIIQAKNLWWLLLILIGAFINTIVVQIGAYQKYKMLKEVYDE